MYIFTLQKKFEDCRVINWSDSENWCLPGFAEPVLEMPRLYALRTKSDGTCLLHALSVGLSGFHDDRGTLRQALHHTV